MEAPGAVPSPPNLLNGAPWPPPPRGPRGAGGTRPSSGGAEKPPAHPGCCWDTGPQRGGLSLPGPRRPLRLERGSAAPRLDQTPLREGQEGAGLKPRARPSPSPPDPASAPFLSRRRGRILPGGPHCPRETPPPGPQLLGAPGEGRRDPSLESGPQSFRGSAGGLARGDALGRVALGEGRGRGRGSRGAGGGGGRRTPRGHSPGRLRRGHGAGCGAGAARSRLEPPPPPPPGSAVRAPAARARRRRSPRCAGRGRAGLRRAVRAACSLGRRCAGPRGARGHVRAGAGTRARAAGWDPGGWGGGTGPLRVRPARVGASLRTPWPCGACGGCGAGHAELIGAPLGPVTSSLSSVPASHLAPGHLPTCPASSSLPSSPCPTRTAEEA